MTALRRMLLALLCLTLAPGIAAATVTGMNTSATFTCAASTGPYAFTFPAFDLSGITVIETTAAGVQTVLPSTAYTGTAVNNSYMNGGSVTLQTACPIGDTLLIQRTTEETQLSAFTEYMPALYQTFESGLDKLTMEAQDIASARAPTPTPVAGNFLQWNSSGTGLQNVNPVTYPATFSAMTALSGYTYATLPPAPPAGTLARVTDNIRGVWIYTAGGWLSLTGEANVVDFGASPSATGAVNAAAFQAALDSLNSSHSFYPSTLRVPAGRYDINATITRANADYLHILGDGFSSEIRWTGADDAIMFNFSGVLGFSFVMEDLKFNLNDKASTAIKTAGFGDLITFKRLAFLSGKKDVATGKMAMLDNFVETHTGRVEQCWFYLGTAVALGLNTAGSSGGPAAWVVEQNEFQQILNNVMTGANIAELTVRNNVVDQVYTNTTGAGFRFDSVENLLFETNHLENLYLAALAIGPTARPTPRPFTATVRNNIFVDCGSAGDANDPLTIGYADGVSVHGNTFLGLAGHASHAIGISANALGVMIGANTYSTDTAGTIVAGNTWITGPYSFATTFHPVVSQSGGTKSYLLALASQSASTVWNAITPVSTTNTPNVPTHLYAVVVNVMVKSATPGSRFWFCADDTAAWANRATNYGTQYIEAQAAGRYQTGTYIIPFVTTGAFVDVIKYGFSDSGAADTDATMEIVGYYQLN